MTCQEISTSFDIKKWFFDINSFEEKCSLLAKMKNCGAFLRQNSKDGGKSRQTNKAMLVLF